MWRCTSVHSIPHSCLIKEEGQGEKMSIWALLVFTRACNILRYKYESFRISLLTLFFLCSDWSATVEFTDAINGTTYVYRELYSQSLNKVTIFNSTPNLPFYFIIDEPALQSRIVHVKSSHVKSSHVMSCNESSLYMDHAATVRLWCIVCLPVQMDARQVRLLEIME